MPKQAARDRRPSELIRAIRSASEFPCAQSDPSWTVRRLQVSRASASGAAVHSGRAAPLPGDPSPGAASSDRTLDGSPITARTGARTGSSGRGRDVRWISTDAGKVLGSVCLKQVNGYAYAYLRYTVRERTFAKYLGSVDAENRSDALAEGWEKQPHRPVEALVAGLDSPTSGCKRMGRTFRPLDWAIWSRTPFRPRSATASEPDRKEWRHGWRQRPATVRRSRRSGHPAEASVKSRSCISQVWSSTWYAVWRSRYGMVQLPSGLPSAYQARIALTKRSR